MDLGIVSGTYVMTEHWEVVLPGMFRKSFDEDDLVLSRTDAELRVGIWGNDQGASTDDRARWFAEEVGGARLDAISERDGELLRLGWFTMEEDERVFEGFVIYDSGHVHVIGTCEDDEVPLAFLRGIRHHQGH